MNHFSVSIFKSFLRIAGCVTVIYDPEKVSLLAICLLVAEALGILEELVDKRKE